MFLLLVEARDIAVQERDNAVKDYETTKATLESTIIRNEELLALLAKSEELKGKIEADKVNTEQRCEKLEKQLTEISQEKETTRAQLQTMGQENENLKNQLQLLQDAAANASTTATRNNSNIEELQGSLLSVQQQYQSQQERCKLLMIQLETLEKENAELRAENSSKNSSFEHYEQDILQQLKTLEIMKTQQDKVYEIRISKLEEELQVQRTSFDGKVQEFEEQRRKTDEYYKDILTKQDTLSVDNIAKVREEYDIRMKDTEKLHQEENEVLLRQLTELQTKLTIASSTATHAASDETDKIAVIGKLEGQLLVTKQELEQAIRNATVQSKENDKQINNFQTIIDQLRKEKDTLIDQNMQLQGKFNQSIEENKVQRTKLASNAIDKQKQEGESMAKILALQKEIQTSKTLVDTLNVRNDNAEKSMIDLQNKHEQVLQESHNNYREQIANLHADYGEQINQLKVENDTLTKEYTALQTDYGKQGTDMDILRKEVNVQNEQSDALKEEYKVLLNAHTSLLASIGKVNPQSLLDNLPELIKKEVFHYNTPMVVNLSVASSTENSSFTTVPILSEERLLHASLQATALNNNKKVSVAIVGEDNAGVFPISDPETVTPTVPSVNASNILEEDTNVLAGAMHLTEKLANSINLEHHAQQKEAERILESHEMGTTPSSVWIVHSRTPRTKGNLPSKNEVLSSTQQRVSPASSAANSGWVGTRYATGYPVTVVPPIYKNTSPSSKAQVLDKLRHGVGVSPSTLSSSKSGGHFLVKSPVPVNVAHSAAKKYPSPKSNTSSPVATVITSLSSRNTGSSTPEGRAKRTNL